MDGNLFPFERKTGSRRYRKVTAAPADWVCVLNNDIIAPQGWLDGLLSAAADHGLDIVSPALREGPVNYDLEPYAAEFVSAARDALRPGIAHGVCFLVRQRVFEKIGMFDENFWLGQGEDSDFFFRALQAEFGLGVTGRSFLHHFGSVTQNSIRESEAPPPYETRNRDYYRAKWNLTWTRRRLIRFRDKAQLAWWRLREFNRCGHTLCEKWKRGKLIYD